MRLLGIAIVLLLLASWATAQPLSTWSLSPAPTRIVPPPAVWAMSQGPVVYRQPWAHPFPMQPLAPPVHMVPFPQVQQAPMRPLPYSVQQHQGQQYHGRLPQRGPRQFLTR